MKPRPLFRGLWIVLLAALLIWFGLMWAKSFDDRYAGNRFAPAERRCPIGIRDVWSMRHEDVC